MSKRGSGGFGGPKVGGRIGFQERQYLQDLSKRGEIGMYPELEDHAVPVEPSEDDMMLLKYYHALNKCWKESAFYLEEHRTVYDIERYSDRYKVARTANVKSVHESVNQQHFPEDLRLKAKAKRVQIDQKTVLSSVDKLARAANDEEEQEEQEEVYDESEEEENDYIESYFDNGEREESDGGDENGAVYYSKF